MRTGRMAIFSIALASALLAACQANIPTPTELETVRTSSDAYLAYARGDCATVQRLVDRERLEAWTFDEMRHSTLLLQGFCSEIEGDIETARDLYRRLILEAPNSFASGDAVERTRTLKLIDEDPDYERQVRTARERIDPDKRRRTPIDRVSAIYPPLAKARGIGGFVVLEFGITARGDTQNPIVVDSRPPLLFDGSAIRAVRRWQYMRKPSKGEEDRQLIRILFKQDGTANPTLEEIVDPPLEEPTADQDSQASS